MKTFTEIFNNFFDDIIEKFVSLFKKEKKEEQNLDKNEINSYNNYNLPNTNLNLNLKIQELLFELQSNIDNEKIDDIENKISIYYEIYNLINWCAKRKIEVIFKYNIRSEYHPNKRKIFINGSEELYNQFCTILHECGHSIIIDKNLKIPNINKSKYGIKSYLNENLLIFKEEVFAWEKGIELAKNLGIEFDIDDYISFRDKCLQTYNINLNRIH